MCRKKTALFAAFRHMRTTPCRRCTPTFPVPADTASRSKRSKPCFPGSRQPLAYGENCLCRARWDRHAVRFAQRPVDHAVKRGIHTLQNRAGKPFFRFFWPHYSIWLLSSQEVQKKACAFPDIFAGKSTGLYQKIDTKNTKIYRKSCRRMSRKCAIL